MASIGIIGGGIGGLAAANLLAQAGHTVHIFEKNHQLGGRAGSFIKDGFQFDTGPSWYLMPKVFEHYYSLLGTSADEQLELQKLSPAYTVYSEGYESLTITGDLATDMATFEAIEPGAGRALKRYVARSKEIYEFALRYFLYSNFDSVSSLVNSSIISQAIPLLSLALTPLHSHVKKSFKHPRLQQLMEYPMVFLGSSPFSAPALYSLMSALDFDEGVWYPKGTMYAFVDSLVEIGRSLGVQYHVNSPISQIETNGHRATGLKLENGSTHTCDIVLSNADLHFTETSLLPRGAQSYPARYWRKKEPSPSALLLYLGVKDTIPEFSHHTLLFVKEWRKNFEQIFKSHALPHPASLYISKTSASDSTAPKNHENIFVLVPLPAGVELSEDELASAADEYLAQIYDMTGVDLASRIVTKTLFGPNEFRDTYNSWQSSMLGPSHRLSQSAFFRTPNRSKKLDNLFYVGAGTMPGIGVPMCLIGAELVTTRITQYLERSRA